ncbi:hypothetical protein BJX70DRAFT_393145 [Aspergillus crustosus]
MGTSPLHWLLLREERGTTYLSARGTQSLVVSIILTSLATILVSARVYTRTKLFKRMEANDWMIVIAVILSFVFMGFFIVEALNGMGMHLVDIPKPILLKQMKVPKPSFLASFWITIPFYNAALLCAKASILIQYFRVFPSRLMRHICWFMIGLLAKYGSWSVLSGLLNCVPVARFWDPTVKGSCLSSKGLWFPNAAMHIATDLAILIVPIPALAALELPMKQRVALISIFALGGFVCVTSICWLVALKRISDSSDPTYDNIGAATYRGNNNYIHDVHPPAYWGMAGMGGLGVSTTITTHIEDLEYGSCEGDAERVLALKYGVGAGFGIARTQARVYVGDEDGKGGIGKKDSVRNGSADVRDANGEIEEGRDTGVVVVQTEVRTDSTSSSYLCL